MSRYIDVDEYIEYCEDEWIPLNVDAVNEQPVTEIIHCKYCKHYCWESFSGKGVEYFCTRLIDVNSDRLLRVDEYDFCSFGEVTE